MKKSTRFTHPLSFLHKKKGKIALNLTKDIKSIGNEYYRSLGQSFRTLQILAFVALFLFTTIFVLSNSDSITYENLYYFVKDFRTAVDNTDESGTAVVYETDRNMTFVSYKGGLAVAGSERLQLYTATGYLNSSASLSFLSPRLQASTSRLLIYDCGGTGCQIYNSFTKIHSQVEEGNIRFAFLSESGEYLTVTDNEEYSSSVQIYNKRFRKVNRFLLNSYVVSAKINANGSYAAVLSYVCENGVYETRLILTKVGAKETSFEHALENEFPLGIAYLSTDSVLLLTDSALYHVTVKGSVTKIHEFTSGTIEKFSFTDTHLALLFRKTSELSLIVFDNGGKMVYNTNVDDDTYTLNGYRNYFYCQTTSALLRFNAENGKQTRVSCIDEGVLLALSDHRVLLCANGEAKYFRFGS